MRNTTLIGDHENPAPIRLATGMQGKRQVSRDLARKRDAGGRGVSVIVPHYGAVDHAQKLVDRLQRQVLRRPCEIIIVDDCSPTPFPAISGVRLCRRLSNGGFGSAVNAGVALAKYENLLILNSDVEINQSFVEELASTAELRPGHILGPRVINTQRAVEYTARRFPRRRHYIAEWLEPLARFRSTMAWHRAVGHDIRVVTGHDFDADWLVGCALFASRQAFLSIGGFDPHYHMNCEEVDLQLRLRARGITARYVAAINCRHESGSSSGGAITRRGRLCASRLAYVEKWNGRRARFELQVALTLATGVNTLWRVARRLARRPVRPIEQARLELSLIWQPTKALRPKP